MVRTSIFGASAILLVLVVAASGCFYGIDGGLIEPDQGAPPPKLDNGLGGGPDRGLQCNEAGACTGALCSQGVPCPAPLECIYPAGGWTGYCSFACEEAGGECESPIEGSFLGCALEIGTTYRCIFFCQVRSDPYDCPPPLECVHNAPSGQQICVPPSES